MTSCLGSKCFKNRSRSSTITKNICGDLTKDVLGIAHYTSYRNLLSIINDGKIISKIEALQNKKKFDQISSYTTYADVDESEFPGVFTGLILRQNIGYYFDDDADCFLIFSKVLLKQKNYHVRSMDNMGLLDEDAYSREYIDKAIEKMKKNIEKGGFYSHTMSDNEVVFHNPISINALEAIFVTKESMYNKLKKNLPQPYNDMVELKTTVEDRVFNKYCNLSLKKLNKKNIIDTKLKPNFCIFIHHDWTSIQRNGRHTNIPKYIDPSVYKKFADNCGVNIADLTKEYNESNKDDSALEIYYKKVNKRIEPAVIKQFKTNERLKPKWIPGKNLYDIKSSSSSK
jgi:hypothetical protein